MRLFIAEKPSLGREIAANLGKGTSKNGYIEVNGGEDIVTWEFGHILEQCAPSEYNEKYKKWNLADLPINPGNDWKLKVKKDAANQFRIIKGLLAKADYVVNAGDPDREGQLLVDELLEYLDNKKPVKRILLNALDEKSVKAALADLRNNKDFVGLRDSARARSQADWLVGMNLTRAYSLKNQAAGYDGTINVGRVKTPTLALVVRREEDIKHFVPTAYYDVQIIWKHKNGLIPTTWKIKKDMDDLDNDGRLLKKSIADGLLTKVQTVALSGGAWIDSIEQKKKQEGQKLPYSLSTLQVEAGRKYGLSPQQVLDTMQSLYEKKVTTYPRSDCEYLPTNQLSDAASILKNLAGIREDNLSGLVAKADVKIVSRAWNDKKISAHHALIPTTVKADFVSFSDTERKLYLMVAKAYLAQFYPLHTYQATKISITCADENFVSTGKVVLQMGWKEIYAKDAKEDKKLSVLPDAMEGDSLSYDSGSVQERVTTPPKRFTEATLLQAMKEIGKYVQDKSLSVKLKECKGIGTEATRANVIEELKTASFVTVEKKLLIPTEKAIRAIHFLPDEITYPDTTALWEAELEKIAEGKLSLDVFINHQTEIINNLLDAAKNLKITPNESLPLCPKCGKFLKLRKGSKGMFWGCSGYPDCKTTFPDKRGKPDFEALKVSAAECPICHSKLHRRKGKFGVFWSCENKESCNAVFSDHKNKPVIVKCPKCNKGYLKKAESKKTPGKFYWFCNEHCGAKSVWDKDGMPNLK